LGIFLFPEKKKKESSLKALIGYFKSKEYISLYETSNAISNVKVEISIIIILLGVLLLSL